VAAAGAGIAWMYGRQFSAAAPAALAGTAIALAVPLASAANWTLLQHLRGRNDEGGDMLPAVLIGAVVSALLTLPLALPFQASGPDIAWLALLGVVQLAIPCLLAVAAARALSAPEASLLSLLEVVLGVVWVWLGAGEAPEPATLAGGLVVLAALAAHEFVALRRIA
jgi:drug/metabolite transporter (DMT)-like permease